jgi:hypothetical protein
MDSSHANEIFAILPGKEEEEEMVAAINFTIVSNV